MIHLWKSPIKLPVEPPVEPPVELSVELPFGRIGSPLGPGCSRN